MPHELPYLPTYKNVGLLFEKIRTARVPEAFTQKYLHDTLGLKSSGDRSLIALLKTLGFIDNAGKPTSAFAQLKNEKVAGTEIARSIRAAYAPLFASNENAHTLGRAELRGLIAQVAGSDDKMTSKIVGTFNALLKVADFKAEDTHTEAEGEDEETDTSTDLNEKVTPNTPLTFTGLRPEFHYNIQVHLPSSGSEETYMNIFNALRKVFK